MRLAHRLSLVHLITGRIFASVEEILKLNLKQLDAFRAVMTAGSTSEAAIMLNISQPAVSRSLQNLEESVSYKLFIRKNGRLFPTAEAEHLFQELDQLYTSFDHIAHVMKTTSPLGDGHIRIVASTPMAQKILPEAIAKFREMHPSVNIALRVVVKREAAKWLESQQFDLAVLTFPIDYPTAYTQNLAAVDAVCILPSGHPLARRAVVEAADLAAEQFISIVPGTTLRNRVDQTFESLGIKRTRMLLETQSGASICQMVSAGLGVSVIDPFNAEAYRWSGIVIKPFRPVVQFQYGLFLPLNRQLGRQAQQFCSQLLERANAMSGNRLAASGDV
jgi:DNA-binding transcriptional LysR family regulator